MENENVQNEEVKKPQPKKKNKVLYWGVVILGSTFIIAGSMNIGTKLAKMNEPKDTIIEEKEESNVNDIEDTTSNETNTNDETQSQNTSNNNTSNNNVSNTETKVVEVVKYQYNLSKRTNNQQLDAGLLKLYVDIEGNAYVSLAANFETNAGTNKDALLNFKKSFKDYYPKNYQYPDGRKNLNSYKLDVSKVLFADYVFVGNSGDSYIVLIKENGTLSYFSYDEVLRDGKVTLKNVDKLNNIVNIVSNNNLPYAIDINGKEILLNNYIK